MRIVTKTPLRRTNGSVPACSAGKSRKISCLPGPSRRASWSGPRQPEPTPRRPGSQDPPLARGPRIRTPASRPPTTIPGPAWRCRPAGSSARSRGPRPPARRAVPRRRVPPMRRTSVWTASRRDLSRRNPDEPSEEPPSARPGRVSSLTAVSGPAGDTPLTPSRSGWRGLRPRGRLPVVEDDPLDDVITRPGLWPIASSWPNAGSAAVPSPRREPDGTWSSPLTPRPARRPLGPTPARHGRPGGPGLQPGRSSEPGLSPWQRSHQLWTETGVQWEQEPAAQASSLPAGPSLPRRTPASASPSPAQAPAQPRPAQAPQPSQAPRQARLRPRPVPAHARPRPSPTPSPAPPGPSASRPSASQAPPATPRPRPHARPPRPRAATPPHPADDRRPAARPPHPAGSPRRLHAPESYAPDEPLRSEPAAAWPGHSHSPLGAPVFSDPAWTPMTARPGKTGGATTARPSGSVRPAWRSRTASGQAAGPSGPRPGRQDRPGQPPGPRPGQAPARPAATRDSPARPAREARPGSQARQRLRNQARAADREAGRAPRTPSCSTTGCPAVSVQAPRPPRPPRRDDRGARPRARGRGRAGPRAADRPCAEVRPAHRGQAQEPGDQLRRTAAAAGRGHPRHLSRTGPARRLPDHQPRRGLGQYDRDDGVADQRRRGPPAVPGLDERRRDLASRPGQRPRRRPGRAGRARPPGHAAGRRRGRLGGDRPAGHLDQPERAGLDPRVAPRDQPAAARRLGVGDHQDRPGLPGRRRQLAQRRQRRAAVRSSGPRRTA